MTPIAARTVMILIVGLVTISAIVLVNSRFHGSFLIGLLVIVLPLLILSYLLPRVLPVRCPNCGGKMQFRFRRLEEKDFYSYVCSNCANHHEWEGASSGSSLDN